MKRPPPALASAVALSLAYGGCRSREDAFTARVAARARETQAGSTVTVNERFHLEIVGPDGTRHDMFLDNLWLHCQTDAQGCDASIDRSVALVAQSQPTNEAFLKPEFVRPLLKDREWVEMIRRTMKEGPPEKAEENAVLSRPFVADLFVVYAFDLPDGMRMLSRADLVALKLDQEQLHALALANLEKATPALLAESRPGSRIRRIHLGDHYEASRVFLHDRWKSLARDVEGDLVVAAPSRDVVYFTGSREDVAGLRTLARRAVAESDHAVSATLLRWKADGWEALP